MTGRRRLPQRRASETFDLEVAGLAYTATISRFDDGRLGEVFLSSPKLGSAADTTARDSAIVASIALQHGAPVDVIRRALCRDSAGRPNGPLGAALDLVAAEAEAVARMRDHHEALHELEDQTRADLGGYLAADVLDGEGER